MQYIFLLEKHKYERELEPLCMTADKEELIRLCNSIDEDYNVTVWKNNDLMDVYLDIKEHEIRKLF